MKSHDDRNEPAHATASAVETAGSAGSEGLSAAPAILEWLLHDCPHRSLEQRTFANGAVNEGGGERLVRMLREAYAIVEEGHVHLGLIYPEARSFIEPLLSAADELAVVYEYGVAWIHTAPPGFPPIIESRGDGTIWDFVDEHPSKIRQVSVYVMQNGRLTNICTKPARGYFDEEAHY